MKKQLFLAALVAVLAFAATASASFIVEPFGTAAATNFGFGGDTTSAGASVASTAIGNSGASSAFGGNGFALPDTYLYTYLPGTDGDNVTIAAGQALNDDGNISSGLTAGASGTYDVFATWPHTTNVSGGPTLYELTDGVSTLISHTVDQNDDDPLGGPGPDGNIHGNEWYYLGSVALDAATTYTLSQSPTVTNGYVSMRSGGVLFELIPEPTSLALVGLGMTMLLASRRRNA